MRNSVSGRLPSLRVLTLLSACVLMVQGCNDDTSSAPAELLVAWTNDSGDGVLGAISMAAPWRFDDSTMTIAPQATLRCGNGDLYVVSQLDGTVSIVDRSLQKLEIIAALGAGEPVDIAVADSETAYITRRTATHMLRLDIASGVTTEVVDLSGYADDDGIPDLGTMATHEGRLYVQILRAGTESGFALPPYVAVIDLETEELIDTEPDIPGIQAIELLGTAPKHKMQVLPESRELFVSASGALHDQGGLEVIDLDTLRSKGLIVSEAVDPVGADLGAFIMTTPEEGFLVSSTDFDVSSHLLRFSIDGGIDPPPDLAQSIGYAAPSLALDSRRETLFFPSGEHGKRGIFVIDVATGELLAPTPVETDGVPSDVVPECSG